VHALLRCCCCCCRGKGSVEKSIRSVCRDAEHFKGVLERCADFVCIRVFSISQYHGMAKGYVYIYIYIYIYLYVGALSLLSYRYYGLAIVQIKADELKLTNG